ncbi:hypothetical protein QWI38_19565, partial [Acinetobacter pittii]|nr:hypothetical protein [Acinetobacter pittii]
LSPLSEISTIVASHINPQEYSQLIYEKGLNVTVYLKNFYSVLIIHTLISINSNNKFENNSA